MSHFNQQHLSKDFVGYQSLFKMPTKSVYHNKFRFFLSLLSQAEIQ
jgi:hypothetical protein